MLDATTKLPLKDPALFRQANYIAGAWVQADSDKMIPVRNPATGEVIGEVPAMGRRKRAAPLKPLMPPGRPGARCSPKIAP